MTVRRLEITLQPEVLEALDEVRGFEPRASFVKRALDEKLSQCQHDWSPIVGSDSYGCRRCGKSTLADELGLPEPPKRALESVLSGAEEIPAHIPGSSRAAPSRAPEDFAKLQELDREIGSVMDPRAALDALGVSEGEARSAEMERAKAIHKLHKAGGFSYRCPKAGCFYAAGSPGVCVHHRTEKLKKS